jgi:hypothetical protein
MYKMPKTKLNRNKPLPESLASHMTYQSKPVNQIIESTSLELRRRSVRARKCAANPQGGFEAWLGLLVRMAIPTASARIVLAMTIDATSHRRDIGYLCHDL